MTANQSNGRPVMRLRYLVPYSLIFFFVPILTFIIGRWVDQLFQLPSFPPFPFNVFFGVGIMLIGAAIGIKATRQLRFTGKGLPWGALDEEAKTKFLVTKGIYSHTRNPVVLGYMLLPLGMGFLFHSLGMAILFPAVILLIMIIRIKKWEEPDLEKRFGEKYLEYKHKTPFLLPRIRPVLIGFFTRRRTKPESKDSSTPS
ncbi:MAG: isoprenylcysteine carboxylmethyltransferase family protein [Candidatus Hermodarchaeota archaeon]|nr:isoprenylcysteine carboxylmethyltransferase family protein [Candidatus Hermodarchaeota archaeon]